MATRLPKSCPTLIINPQIHSALYVHNATLLRLGFRLHLPTPLLTRHIVPAQGDSVLPGEQDIRMRPLKPGEGKLVVHSCIPSTRMHLQWRWP